MTHLLNIFNISSANVNRTMSSLLRMVSSGLYLHFKHPLLSTSPTYTDHIPLIEFIASQYTVLMPSYLYIYTVPSSWNVTAQFLTHSSKLSFSHYFCHEIYLRVLKMLIYFPILKDNMFSRGQKPCLIPSLCPQYLEYSSTKYKCMVCHDSCTQPKSLCSTRKIIAELI